MLLLLLLLLHKACMWLSALHVHPILTWCNFAVSTVHVSVKVVVYGLERLLSILSDSLRASCCFLLDEPCLSCHGEAQALAHQKPASDTRKPA